MFDLDSLAPKYPEYVRFIKRTKKVYFGDIFEEKFKVICDYLLSLPVGTNAYDMEMMDTLFCYEGEYRLGSPGTAYRIIYLFKDFFIDEFDMFYFFSLRRKFADYHGINFIGRRGYFGPPYYVNYVIEHTDSFTPIGEYISKTQRMKVKALMRKYNNFQPQPFEEFSSVNVETYRDNYIMSVLDLITPNDNGQLLLGCYGGSNYETYLAFERKGKPILFEQDKNQLLKNVTVPFSVNGIWQAFVLSDLWSTALPLGWHSNYNRTEYVLEEKVFTNKGTIVPKGDEYKFDAFYVSKNYLPKIALNADYSANIQLCVWNNWSGLSLVKTKAIWKNGRVRFNKPKAESLVMFNCGIVF